MTKKELSINIVWDEFEMGTCRLFVPLLEQYISSIFFQDHKPNPTISNKMLQSVNDILAMNESEFDRLGKILENEKLGNEIYKQSKIKEIHIDQDNDVYEGVYSEVIIDIGSNKQVSIIVKDGKFMCINDGGYFDTLVPSDKKVEAKGLSKEEREKLISLMSSE